MNWWGWLLVAWLGLAATFALAWLRLGTWYRSSPRQTELDRMIRKQRRRDRRRR